jgi:hypothetical protein
LSFLRFTVTYSFPLWSELKRAISMFGILTFDIKNQKVNLKHWNSDGYHYIWYQIKKNLFDIPKWDKNWRVKLVLIVLNLPPFIFVLSPDSKMVKNIKIGWKLTKLWKIFLGEFKNKIDTNYSSEIWNYGLKNYGKEIPILPYPVSSTTDY